MYCLPLTNYVMVANFTDKVFLVLPADSMRHRLFAMGTVIHNNANLFIYLLTHRCILPPGSKINKYVGRYVLYDTSGLGPRFHLTRRHAFVSEDNYNVAPFQWLPVIMQYDSGERVAEPMQWGFIPPWSKDPRKGPRPINAKAETVFESRMWSNAIAHHRCLVPSRGFYEWKLRAEQVKLPYFIHPKDQKLFAFAGIFSIWNDAEGHPLKSFSIITTQSNQEMLPIHDRMPVILAPDQESEWLDPAYSEQERLATFLIPYEDGKLEIYRVSDVVNSSRHNGPHLMDAVQD